MNPPLLLARLNWSEFWVRLVFCDFELDGMVGSFLLFSLRLVSFSPRLFSIPLSVYVFRFAMSDPRQFPTLSNRLPSNFDLPERKRLRNWDAQTTVRPEDRPVGRCDRPIELKWTAFCRLFQTRQVTTLFRDFSTSPSLCLIIMGGLPRSSLGCRQSTLSDPCTLSQHAISNDESFSASSILRPVQI